MIGEEVSELEDEGVELLQVSANLQAGRIARVILFESSLVEGGVSSPPSPQFLAALPDPCLLRPWGAFPYAWVRRNGYQMNPISTSGPPDHVSLSSALFSAAYPSCLQIGDEEA
jgi:hypothetical protein